MNAMRDMQDCGYSYEFSNLVMNCVHKIPNSRPTFGQFLSEISRIKQNLMAKNYVPRRWLILLFLVLIASMMNK